jgi:protein-L-isoaspartate(D-aspartate) O-methyltransferase
LIRECAEPFQEIEGVDLSTLLERIGDARVVCLGESTHGTAEFYDMRAEITRRLIETKGFDLVAVEGDWPDLAVLDSHVRERPRPQGEAPFQRFPTWMWRNRQFADFVSWLRDHNQGRAAAERVGLFGLDVYSLFRSRDAVLTYLERVDPETAKTARLRYGCLSPWERDPALYGRAATSGGYRSCEKHVVENLRDLLRRRLDYQATDPLAFFDAAQNARVVVNAERYYRVMYYGQADSWNLRDQHMFDTMLALLENRGPESKIVVWEHNSHVGNAAATEMAARGEHNVGKLAKDRFGTGAYLVGFGTDRGTVMAADEWGGDFSVKKVRPALMGSYERLFAEAELPAALLHLRQPTRPELRDELEGPLLERAIGVIYRPETELQSHYFQAILPWQFDSYVWFDRSQAVTPLAPPAAGPDDHELAHTYPFGL